MKPVDCVGVDDGLEHDPFFQAIVGLVDYPHLLQDRRLACKLAHSCTRFPCYLGTEINQCRDPMNNNKDCRVGQLTRWGGENFFDFLTRAS